MSEAKRIGKKRPQPEAHPAEDFATWRKQFLLDSAQGLNALFADDEPEYSEADLVEVNSANADF